MISTQITESVLKKKKLLFIVFRLKKDVERKDVMIDTNMVQYHSEM